MKQAHIRGASITDVNALERCVAAAYAVYAQRIVGLPDVTAGIEQDVLNNIVLVAEISDDVVGGVFLTEGESEMLLANIAVHPDHAGKGVGRALMEAAEALCRERNIQAMRLHTHVDMPENIALYTHYGWHEETRVGNSVRMHKQLR